MDVLKQQIKEHTPKRIWHAASDLRYALQRAAMWPKATFHPARRASIQMLEAYKNRHAGQRCFILGNGPSLKQTDLSCLRGEFTFGLNRIYMLFPELGFPTTYLLSVNDLVIEQCASEILALPIPKFLSWRSYPLLEKIDARPPLDVPSAIFLHTTYTGPKFARDARGRLWEGATVTFVALQLAFYMGFAKVILIGVDHSFTTQGKPNTTVISQGDDPNHFHAGYFGRGFRWQLPDLNTSEQGYQLARQEYEAHGRQVLDATIGGKLTIFPKIDYQTLFEA